MKLSLKILIVILILFIAGCTTDSYIKQLTIDKKQWTCHEEKDNYICDRIISQ